MADASNREVIWPGLRRRLADVLNSIVPARAQVAYLDYPFHWNVGDLMIALGTDRWMMERELRVLLRRPKEDFKDISLPPDAILLLHGGR